MLFSLRHEDALRDSRLKPSFRLPLRNRLAIIVEERSEYDYGGPYVINLTLEEAGRLYKKELGLETIGWVGEQKRLIPSDLAGVIRNGFPSQVLDAVEAFSSVLAGEKANSFQHEVNRAFIDFRSPWQLVEGCFWKVESEYLSEEVANQARSLLGNANFLGAQDEFDRARAAFTDGNFPLAITLANNALESTIKSVIEVERAKPGELLSMLTKSGLVPSYYDGFLNNLEQFMRAVQIERNEPGRGHGAGKNVARINPSLAELSLHLSATLIVFLTKRWLEKSQLPAEELPF